MYTMSSHLSSTPQVFEGKEKKEEMRLLIYSHGCTFIAYRAVPQSATGCLSPFNAILGNLCELQVHFSVNGLRSKL